MFTSLFSRPKPTDDLSIKAADLRNDIAQILSQDSLTATVKSLNISSLIQVSVSSWIDENSSIKDRAESIQKDLEKFAKPGIDRAFEIEKTAALKKAKADAQAAAQKVKAAIKAFKTEISNTSDEILKTFKIALKNPQANIVALLNTAKAVSAQLAERTCPELSPNETTEFVQPITQQLNQNLVTIALTTQAKKTDKAFADFLKKAKPLKETIDFLDNTKKEWNQKFFNPNDPRQSVQDLSETPFQLTDAQKNTYDVEALEAEKDALETEVESLSILKGIEILPPEMAKKVEHVELLMSAAKTAATSASILVNAKQAADQYFPTEKRAQPFLQEATQGLEALTALMQQYNSAQKTEVSDLLNQINETHGKIRAVMSELYGFSTALFKAVSRTNYNLVSANLMSDLAVQKAKVSELSETFVTFQKIEESFKAGNFGEINIEFLAQAPVSFYANLKEIVSQKLAPLSQGGSEEEVANAKAYRRNVINWLKQIGDGIVKGQFDLDGLKLSFGEKFWNFILSIVALLTSAFGNRASAPAAMDSSEDAAPAPFMVEEPLPAAPHQDEVPAVDLLALIDELDPSDDVDANDQVALLNQYYNVSDE